MGEKICELGAVTVGPGVRMLEFVGEFLAANPGDVTNRWLKETPLGFGAPSNSSGLIEISRRFVRERLGSG